MGQKSDQHAFVESGGRARVGHNNTFPLDVLNAGKKYKKTYETLTTRERKRRIQFFTKELLAACADKDLLRKMGRNFFWRTRI